MKRCKLLFLLIGLFSVNFLQAQQSAKKIWNEAELYFQNEKYVEAAALFQSYQTLKPKDGNAKLMLGICNYHNNKLIKAKKYLVSLLESDKKSKINPDTYYWLAKIDHANHEFKEAIFNYKEFLRKTKEKHPLRNAAKDDILRSANGIILAGAVGQALVENMGNKVNGDSDDFAPVLSPNYEDKIYFSSARIGNVGGKLNKNGQPDSRFGDYTADVFSCEVLNGEWKGTRPLGASLINSERHDVVLDFIDEGRIMFLFSGPTLYSGEILVDTFKVSPEDRPTYLPNFEGPVVAENADGTPYFFDDTTLIFASRKEGGFGGSDLYISNFSDGQWSAPENLGPQINSAYDETTPFLANDGRTLYFSANGKNSIGGFDVFKSKFDDRTRGWISPVNMGMPINSAGDDTYFKINFDGSKAYFSSGRKIDSYGQRDIFVAYFKKTQIEQQGTSYPLVFNQVGKTGSGNPSGLVVDVDPFSGIENNNEQLPPAEIVEYKISTLQYGEDDFVMTPINTKKLDEVSRLMLAHSQLVVELISHSDETGPAEFDLYFSIKRAEKAAAYLIDNGVNPNQIILKGCGSPYPIAKNKIKGKENPAGRKLNRRIEIAIHNTARLPIKLNIDEPKVSSFMKSEAGAFFKKSYEKLSYKIEVAAINQMYKGNVIKDQPYATIESSGLNKTYRYTVNLFQDYNAAAAMLMELEATGLENLQIIPYMDGVRITDTDVKIYAANYPDLLKYIAAEEGN